MFPHHENERAQSECANGCEFSKYWLHNGFVTINKEKMSKSLNNFLTIDDILEKYDTNAIRLFILTNHYRMPVEFNEISLDAAKNGSKRLINATVGFEKKEEYDKEKVEEFKAAMNDDLNTSKALAVLFSLVDIIKKEKTNNPDKAQIAANTLYYLGETLGFDFSLAQKEVTEEELKKIIEPLYQEFNLDSEISPKEALEEIIKIRKTARDNKDWAKSDEIRDILLKNNIQLKDSKEKTTWQVI